MAMLQARSRKDADRPARPPQPQPMSPARAAANAAGRAAERLYRLPVLPVEVRPGVATLAELPELLPEQSLLVVLQGPGDQIGAMALDLAAVTALIEVQALGRVTSRPVERRKLTRSDAAICVDFVDALMTELGTEMAAVEGFCPMQGFRFATYLDDPRPLTLMMEDRAYRTLSFELRFGGAETRDGTILLAVPHGAALRPGVEPAAGTPSQAAPAGPAAAPAPSAAPFAAPSAAARPAPAPGSTLAGAVRDAPVEVVGVLCRRHVTLGELRGLVPGKLLPLPRVNLSEARLETPDGQLLAIGKLGESDGCHALRLHDPSGSVSARPTHREAEILATLPAAAAEADPFRSMPGASPVDDLAPLRVVPGA